MLRTHQPAGSFVAAAPAEAVAQAAHEPHACKPAALAQRRQRVPLGALPRKVHVLWPHAPALIHPLRAEVVRRNQAQVGRAEPAAARWPSAISGDVNRPSLAPLIKIAANNACPSIHLRGNLQIFDAHA
jgi:hypothetical protein